MRSTPLRLSLVAALGLAMPASAQGEHETPTPEQKPVNRLAKETSPYLRQHQFNPVDWYPWGKEALERAKKEDKPIFLSIGYAACHWCHVMERESFENEVIARQMNQQFVCIKVDREERPDLDEIYMTAVTGLTGSGGWPMSVWLTPNLQPFYGGTYFPPEDRDGVPGFPRVLQAMRDLWDDDREKVTKQAAALQDFLRDRLAPEANPADPKPDLFDLFVEQSEGHFDEAYGGFGRSPFFRPKFPHATELLLLLRRAADGDRSAASIVRRTLTPMANGGLHDQLGGGFHRYSTDRRFLVPHFEKMLYDNALLLEVYAEAALWNGDKLYEQVVRRGVEYLLREMQHEQGGFFSTQDADSEGEEGKFFVWTREEIDALCGDDAPVARAFYGVKPGGNWEGRSILEVVATPAEVAAQLGLEEFDVRQAIERARATLFAARKQRIAPGTDDKILAAWNGMALRGLASAYRLTEDPATLAAARRCAAFVLDSMRVDGRLKRSWRNGDLRFDAYLEDYAYLADGLLALHQVDGDPRWLAEAKTLCQQMVERFGDDEDGSFFFTAEDHEELIARSKSVTESSQPSAISMAVRAFLGAGLLLGDEQLFERGRRALRAHHETLSALPIACPGLAVAADLALGGPREVVIVGDPEDPATRALLRAAWRRVPQRDVVSVVRPEDVDERARLSPIFLGKVQLDGKPTAYVCTRGVCQAPVTDPAALGL